tara:strand:- start:310926 stop:312515 length:1590 start_codon:yes stop_codon:yes gene_type:complete
MSEVKQQETIIYDIAIVGAGINGCGIARDAAGRGLKTFICDKGDLGGETSCYSSKLIHGGLRYLEFFEFGLVRKALKERDTLMHIAPHLVHEQRFIIPHSPHLRPQWLIRLGLFLYDNLHWSKTLKGSESVSLRYSPLKDEYEQGFAYSDCKTDDHRLVIANALDAQNNGAAVQPYTTCTHAVIQNGLWRLTLETPDGKESYAYAKSLVNATGPWVETFIKDNLKTQTAKHLKLVKGSHIVTHKLYEGNQAYTFQDKEGRIVFTIPYEKDYTLIGTTEEAFKGNPSDAQISNSEIEYLRDVISAYFDKPITSSNTLWEFAGVRPLIDEGGDSARKTTRDYSVELNTQNIRPLVHIWGGKLTTYRVLAEDVLQKLEPYLGKSTKWSAMTPLNTSVQPQSMAKGLGAQYPWLAEDMIQRFVFHYGKNSLLILKGCTNMKDMGEHYGAGLYEQEVRYLIKEEWARTADAVLWHRTKCGLHMTKEQRDTFEGVFENILSDMQRLNKIEAFEEKEREDGGIETAPHTIASTPPQ